MSLWSKSVFLAQNVHNRGVALKTLEYCKFYINNKIIIK